MARITFFCTPAPRVYSYKPRYYDPEKEKLQELYRKYGYTEDGKKKAEEEAGATAVRKHKYIPGVAIHGAMQRNIENQRRESNPKIKAIITVVSILLAILVVYYLCGFFELLIR